MKNFEVANTAALVTLCSAPENAEGGLYDDAVMFCQGFVVGAAHYHDAVTGGPDSDPIVCAGGEVSRDVLIDVFLTWTKAHPDSLSRPAVQSLVRAAVAKWPCK